MTQDILTTLAALRDRVRRSLLDNPEFRALVSIEQSISEIEDAVTARAATLSAQIAAAAEATAPDESQLAPPQPANIGRAIFERASMPPQAPLAEPARHQPFLPTHRVA